MLQQEQERIKTGFQVGYYTEFEKEILTYVKKNADSVIFYTTLRDLIRNPAGSYLLYLMYSKPYFRTTHLVRPDIASNPQLTGLTTEGEERLQELLTK